MIDFRVLQIVFSAYLTLGQLAFAAETNSSNYQLHPAIIKYLSDSTSRYSNESPNFYQELIRSLLQLSLVSNETEVKKVIADIQVNSESFKVDGKFHHTRLETLLKETKHEANKFANQYGAEFPSKFITQKFLTIITDQRIDQFDRSDFIYLHVYEYASQMGLQLPTTDSQIIKRIQTLGTIFKLNFFSSDRNTNPLLGPGSNARRTSRILKLNDTQIDNIGLLAHHIAPSKLFEIIFRRNSYSVPKTNLQYVISLLKSYADELNLSKREFSNFIVKNKLELPNVKPKIISEVNQVIDEKFKGNMYLKLNIFYYLNSTNLEDAIVESIPIVAKDLLVSAFSNINNRNGITYINNFRKLIELGEQHYRDMVMHSLSQSRESRYAKLATVYRENEKLFGKEKGHLLFMEDLPVMIQKLVEIENPQSKSGKNRITSLYLVSSPPVCNTFFK